MVLIDVAFSMLASVSGRTGSWFGTVSRLMLALDVPYIANFIYEHPGELDLNLKGISIADPSLSYSFVQEDIPALRFAQVTHPLHLL